MLRHLTSGARAASTDLDDLAPTRIRRQQRRNRANGAANPSAAEVCASPRSRECGTASGGRERGGLYRRCLLRRCPRRIDELRDPFVAALEGRAIHRLELGWREGMRRRAPEQRVAPRTEAREFLEMAELLHPVE